MSKILKNLAQAVQDAQTNKYTAALQKNTTDATPAVPPINEIPVEAAPIETKPVVEAEETPVTLSKIEQPVAETKMHSASQDTRSSQYERSFVPPVQSEHRSFAFNQSTLYGTLAAFGITAVLSLMLSFKTVIQMKDNEVAMRNLTSIASEQGKKVKGVESSIVDVLDKQERKLSALEKNLQEIDRTVGRSDQRISKMAAEALTIRVNIDELKTSQRDLRVRYGNMNDEIKNLKKLSFEMPSENISSP